MYHDLSRELSRVRTMCGTGSRGTPDRDPTVVFRCGRKVPPRSRRRARQRRPSHAMERVDGCKKPARPLMAFISVQSRHLAVDQFILVTTVHALYAWGIPLATCTLPIGVFTY